MRTIRYSLLTVLAGLSLGLSAQVTIDINCRKPTTDIAPTMYGIFFEDINYGADGGLYAELVKNRSFEFPERLMGWQTAGPVSIVETSPFDRCPHALRMEAGYSAVENEGFFGMGFRSGAQYRLSVWARCSDGKPTDLKIELIDKQGLTAKAVAKGVLEISSADWQKYEVVLTSVSDCARGSLGLFHDGEAAVELDHVSLFPVDTWRGHTNGMRRDLVQALADLQPKVFRFPGGCVVEGNTLPTRYQWKNSVGPVENRPLNENRWLDAMPARRSPDYFQSLGLGFYEYFLLSEEIGAEPLPVLNAGMACEFVNDPTKEGDWLVPLDQLQPYIDDALDLIEFANGDPAKNEWARLRAEMGHPAPFNLKYLAIGNEQWGRWFAPRLKMFSDQIRAKYPHIKLIGTAGPSPEGEEYETMWSEMRELKADLVDEHYYHSVEWFLTHATRYDNFPRKGPKVFAGEYACHTTGISLSHNNYAATLAEAAFMTGLERNADVVRMATYAPLFAQAEGWQWCPDLIWFDSYRVARSASYYVQQMFSRNAGTHVLKTTLAGKPVAGLDGQNGLYASAALDRKAKVIIVKIVNTSSDRQSVLLNLTGLKGTRSVRSTLLLPPADEDSDNSVENPDHIVPSESILSLNFASDPIEIPARSFMVLRFKN